MATIGKRGAARAATLVSLLAFTAGGCGGEFSLILGPDENDACLEQDVFDERCHTEEVIEQQCYDQETIIETCDEVFGILVCTEETIIETVCEDIVVDVVEVCETVVVDTIVVCP